MADYRVQRAWQEQVVFPERGARIVHYILRDTAGNSLLAVVGIERSIRHMMYSVSAEFLRAFGSTSKVNAETKWTSRQEVVDWLVPLVAKKAPIFPNSSQVITQKTPSLEHLKSSMARLSSRKNPIADKGSEKSVLGNQNTEIMWSGEAWICNKHLKHYPSFSRRGINIAAYSFVYVMVEKGREYIAYVQDLYEDQNHMKMVRVRWFNFPKDVTDLTSDIETHPREVFMTPYDQDISVECVNGLATVLMPNHFDKCLNFIPEFLPSETFLCHREVSNRKIKHCCLSQLRGYSSQPVISCLISHVQKLPEVEGSEQPKLVQEPQQGVTFNINDNVEILSQDSGLRGCWFRCKVLRVSPKRLRVQYYDLLDVDGPKKLEEWVLSDRVSNLDVLGMRHTRRLTIRPLPFDDKSDLTEFSVGSAVDAWWNDGWWEGVLIGYDTSSLNNLQLFFPGEKKFRTIERKNIRASRDWIDGKWTNIRPKPNILSAISAVLNHTHKPSQPLNSNGTRNSAPVNSNIHSIKIIQGPNNSAASFSKEVMPKTNKELHYKKQLITRYREEQAAKSFDNAGKVGTKSLQP